MNTKICGICKLEKPVTEFYKNKSKKDGLQFRCIVCCKALNFERREYNKERNRIYYYAHQEENKAASKAYYQAHIEQARANGRRYRREVYLPIEREKLLNRKYNLSVEEYEILLKAQGGVCAICHLPERTKNKANGTVNRLTVDHDHLTGKVRGLLCNRCNRCIGMTQDSSELLQKAVDYLEAGGFNATSNS